MSTNNTNGYDLDRYGPEWYDQHETYTNDVGLIRKLINGFGHLHILEPFCGTGRILIPLAEDGHELVGIDRSEAMLARAEMKIAQLSEDTRKRISLIQRDVTIGEWPNGFDLVILGANCFYELATAEEQEGCIASAAGSLKPGGFLYLDNNHMEGKLDESWREPGVKEGAEWIASDGVRMRGTSETIWYDAPRRLWKSRRTSKAIFPDGTVIQNECVIQKHPVSIIEQKEWLAMHGFAVIHLYGDRDGNAYTKESGRGIFWARKQPE